MTDTTPAPTATATPAPAATPTATPVPAAPTAVTDQALKFSSPGGLGAFAQRLKRGLAGVNGGVFQIDQAQAVNLLEHGAGDRNFHQVQNADGLCIVVNTDGNGTQLALYGSHEDARRRLAAPIATVSGGTDQILDLLGVGDFTELPGVPPVHTAAYTQNLAGTANSLVHPNLAAYQDGRQGTVTERRVAMVTTESSRFLRRGTTETHYAVVWENGSRPEELVTVYRANPGRNTWEAVNGREANDVIGQARRPNRTVYGGTDHRATPIENAYCNTQYHSNDDDLPVNGAMVEQARRMGLLNQEHAADLSPVQARRAELDQTVAQRLEDQHLGQQQRQIIAERTEPLMVAAKRGVVTVGAMYIASGKPEMLFNIMPAKMAQVVKGAAAAIGAISGVMLLQSGWEAGKNLLEAARPGMDRGLGAATRRAQQGAEQIAEDVSTFQQSPGPAQTVLQQAQTQIV